MNATLSKKIRFSDAVYAIGTTPKSLRLWLQRGVVDLHSEAPEGGWHEFSFVDIGILAITRKLSDFGVPVAEAGKIANMIMGDDFYPQMHYVQNPGNIPAGVLASVWSNQRLYVYRNGDGWTLEHVALYETHLSRLHDEGFDPELPSGVAELRKEFEPDAVFISIDVEAVLRTAFTRAEESISEGMDEEE
ncbi:MAG: MerR family transcriptional regulator [Pseudooceanicola sp.]|nr:MerR family transcriptional regulator [Pseudooceanicola sp.]